MVRFFHSKVVMLGAAALLIGGLAAGAAAQGPGPGRPGPGGMRGFGALGPGGPGLPLGQLELSEAQLTQVREVREKYADQARKGSEQLRTAQEAQHKAIQTYPVNEQLVRSTSQALSQALTDVALVQAQMHHDIYSILTPDQQAKARQIDQQREARMKERQQQMQQRRQQRQKPSQG